MRHIRLFYSPNFSAVKTEGLSHQPFQNRTIPPTFRRASVCVCLYGFASVQNSGHTRLRHPCLFMNALLVSHPCETLGVHFRHPCLACPSRCTEPLHPNNHCKKTTIPCFAPSPLPLNERFACFAVPLPSTITLASPRKRGGGTADTIFSLAVQYSDSPAIMILKLFRAVTVGIVPRPHHQ